MTSVMIATPSYGYIPPAFTLSLIETIDELSKAGFTVRWAVHEGCCYVHTARNKLVREFLFHKFDELLFIDADIAWDTKDVVRLCQRDVPIVGGSAPFKVGVQGFPTGIIAGEDGRPEVDAKTGLIQVMPLPTAMMKVQKSVFIDMIKAARAPLRIEYNGQTGEESGRYLSFFDFEVDTEKHLEFGEDVTFCRKWMAMGGKLWVDPDMTLRHFGSNCRIGNLHDHLRALPGGGGEAPGEWQFTPRTTDRAA